MKLKILLSIGVIFVRVCVLNGQNISDQVLEAYFSLLVQQHQLNKEIAANLERISPEMDREYQRILTLTEEEAILPWTYFLKKTERSEQGKPLADLCIQGRKVNTLIRKFHTHRLVDPLSQQTIDTSQASRRLAFFGIQEGEKVAEIGFGYGYNLHLLALAYERIEVYANELDTYKLHLQLKQLTEDFPEDRSDNFYFIAGLERSTNLEGMNLDLIIMENVFHHVEDKITFLESLRISLAPKGEVVIIEDFLDSGREGKVCPDRIGKAEMEQLFSHLGFYTTQRQELAGTFKTMIRLGKRQTLDHIADPD